MAIDRHFYFRKTEIDAYSLDQSGWSRFVREREFEYIFSLLGDRRFEHALEIGSGNGVQSELLAARCDRLICSDLERRKWNLRPDRKIPRNISYIVLDASDLSCFPDDSLDLVYSSNVLEHIEDVDRCIREIFRVLKPSGIGIHSMPSRHWKFFNAFYRLAKFSKPRIHGVESTNWAEFAAFGLKVWANRFKSANFEIEKTIGLPFYFGFDLRWKPLLVMGNRLRLPSSYTLFVRPRKNPK